MDDRTFYEKYFGEQRYFADEEEKQLNRIAVLERLISKMPEPERGLFVGCGKGAEMAVGLRLL